jgi:hypothetical protein
LVDGLSQFAQATPALAKDNGAAGSAIPRRRVATARFGNLL